VPVGDAVTDGGREIEVDFRVEIDHALVPGHEDRKTRKSLAPGAVEDVLVERGIRIWRVLGLICS
jgi:hypothetical protein